MTRRLGIDDLYSLELPEQPALSPDGTRLVYVLRTADREHDRDERELWTVPTGTGAARRLTRGPADTAPAWSPDGARIAFLRGGDGPAQLWLLPADGGEPEQVTELPLGAGAPVWSPDGTSIAFTAPVDRRPAPTAGTAVPPPLVVDRLDHKTDGGGPVGTVRSHLHVVDAASGRLRQVTDGDWHAGAPAWSPDGRSLAFCAARGSTADLTLASEAYVVDVDPAATAAPPRLVGGDEGVAHAVTWTADGTALLVVGRTDTALGHAGLLRVPLDGGPVVDLTSGVDRNVMPGGPGYPGALPRVIDDGRTVLFCLRDRGCSHLYAVDATGAGAPRPVVGGAGRVVAGMTAAKDTAAVVLTTPGSHGEIVAVETATGRERVLTRHGAPLADVELFPAQEREFAISDGGTVHGWLLRDPERTGPAPLLLDIHGGPHNSWNGAADPAHLYHQELVARGWAVLLLNPRGSDGYGEAFFTATAGAWGAADARDFLEPVDALVAEGTADPGRLAVAGYSYGGYMTCYLTGHDDRFAAAVAGGVVSDLTSMCGTSDAGHWLATTELGTSPWLDRDRYAELSPYSRVEQVRTPTLVLHGAADERCPVGQAEQWFNALRVRGVPTRMVLYPGGSHLFLLDGPPSHRTDLGRRIVDWVEQHAGAGAPRRVASGRSAARPVDVAYWERRLAELAGRHRVPGAVLGIARGAHSAVAAHGVLNKDTGVTTTHDSLFQIGSITKVWTATLAMQLVDEGVLDLDAPVADVLPELHLADPLVARQVTMRHLLTHTSGIDGDVFTDTGRGDDCLERFVDRLDEAAQNHPLGATFSYCNSGFVLAGRVVEKLTGTSWDRALQERLCAPLGLERTVTLPEEALRFRAAMGHASEGDAPPRPVPAWGLPRSAGPAGLITATAADVLAFARLHLTGGLAPDGTRLLSERAAQAMTEQQVELPDTDSLGDSWGLGWIRFGWDGRRLIGHDGNTLGQSAFLRVLPEQDLAVTLLTNGGAAADLYRELFGEIFAELAGVAMPDAPRPPAGPVSVDAGRHLGRYERAGTRIDILEGTDGPRLRHTTTGPLAHLVPEPVREAALVPVSDRRFLVQYAGSPSWIPVTFYALPTGEHYVHHGVRATPKVS
ncbi:serine hydrolase [Streptomyces triticagri]|uniref:Serine hydrolase n=1 Tax=Streptomyces triticagri TaxID=2293568 RepID=A0A372LZ63_9ACTN|nr:serine hydrolase [Streptomyces triticagri]RFU83921.1 serine hydrolase [Streptomyces triticagri]